MITMLLQAQERAQAQADVVALGAGGAHLGAFHSTKLFDTTMIVLNRPGITGPAGARQGAHLKGVAGPPFNVTVWGHDLEHFNQAIPFEMDHLAICADLDLAQGAVAQSSVVILWGEDMVLGLHSCVQASFNDWAGCMSQAAGARTFKAELIACPSCGRTLFDLQSTTERIKAKTGHLVGVKIAVMGCVVNGPGESKHADIGISLPGTFEAPVAPVFIDGRLDRTLRGDGVVAEFIEILEGYVAERFPAPA